MKTKLQHLNNFAADDFGYPSLVYQMMMQAYQAGEEVTVVCIAVDNADGNMEHNYYDVQLANGLLLQALSGYHLHGIEGFAPTKKEYQFVVAVQFLVTETPDVKTMEQQFQTAINASLINNYAKRVDGKGGWCSEVSFETSYNI